jgi:hypothetical protein
MVTRLTIGRRTARLMAVAAAVVAALAVWLVAELAFGMELQAPALDGSGKASDISALDVAIVATLLSLAGWGLLALLERLTAHARRAWLIVAPLALVLSLGTPLSGTGVSSANRIVLVLLHLAVGAVLIPALYRTSPGKGGG